MTPPPPFPGGVGLSHLRVYEGGGTPHLHTVCTEAYAVAAGAGAVQTLTSSGYEEVPLEPGAFVWFTPGTIHRLVNGGGLEILVLMGNAGLPEAGDMVITFPPDVVGSADAYEAAAALPDDDRTTAGPGDAARRRRDRAVPEFRRLVVAAEAGDPSPLRAFHEAAGALVRPRLEAWEAIWREGPKAAADRTGEQLAALAAGGVDHLAAASVSRLPPPPAERRLGCCGTLGTYLP